MHPLVKPFRCLKLPGTDPIYKLYDNRTGQWGKDVYIGEAGRKQAEEYAESLNRLYQSQEVANAHQKRD